MSVEPQPPYRNPQLPIEPRLADLLSRMTLEEKIAQLSVLGGIEYEIMEEYDLDRLKETFKYGVGAVSNRAQSLSWSAAVQNGIRPCC